MFIYFFPYKFLKKLWLNFLELVAKYECLFSVALFMDILKDLAALSSKTEVLCNKHAAIPLN